MDEYSQRSVGGVSPKLTRAAGLDGCRGGWVAVSVPVSGHGATRVRRIAHVDVAIAALDRGDLAAVGIDMPIGLPRMGPRRCDVEARQLIGCRRSSVFPAPCRSSLGATSYEDACALSRAANGKGISRQLFGILDKIREIDAVIDERRQRQIFEVHPEVSFATMSGSPMGWYKRTDEGRSERLALLIRHFPDLDLAAGVRDTHAAPDDILDAYAVAWSAVRFATGDYVRLGGELDERGLRMEIIA